MSEKIPLIENPFCLAGDKTFSFHWLRNSNSICIIRLIFPALFPASLPLIRRDKGNSHEHEPCLARRCSLFAIKAPLSVAVFGKISNCERRKKKCLWKGKANFKLSLSARLHYFCDLHSINWEAECGVPFNLARNEIPFI